MFEGIMTIAVTGPQRLRPPSKIDSEMRLARTCFDHLAGELGVAVTDAMVKRRCIVLDDGQLTVKGSNFLTGLGIDVSTPPRSRRAFCRPCLDWSGVHIWPAGLAPRSRILPLSVTRFADDLSGDPSRSPTAVLWHFARRLAPEFDFPDSSHPVA
jgi:hypothetical protein